MHCHKGVPFAYQLNISEYGYHGRQQGRLEVLPFMIHHFRRLGKDLLRSLMHFLVVYSQMLQQQKNIQMDYSSLYLEQVLLNYQVS